MNETNSPRAILQIDAAQRLHRPVARLKAQRQLRYVDDAFRRGGVRCSMSARDRPWARCTACIWRARAASAGNGSRLTNRPRPLLASTLPSSNDDRAARQRVARQALHFDAFEHVVVDDRDLLVGADRLRRLRVPDDDVGVGAGQDRALARIEIENARDVGRGHGDEFVRRSAGPCRRRRSRAPACDPRGRRCRSGSW